MTYRVNAVVDHKSRDLEFSKSISPSSGFRKNLYKERWALGISPNFARVSCEKVQAVASLSIVPTYLVHWCSSSLPEFSHANENLELFVYSKNDGILCDLSACSCWGRVVRDQCFIKRHSVRRRDAWNRYIGAQDRFTSAHNTYTFHLWIQICTSYRLKRCLKDWIEARDQDSAPDSAFASHSLAEITLYPLASSTHEMHLSSL